jgi:hypothetical protein
MLNKLKTKLKLKLINWLEIDKLNSNINDLSKYLTNSIKANQQDIYTLGKEYKIDYNDLDNKYNSLHRTIQECVKMGADIQVQPNHNNRTGSWAVVCFKRGNTNIVKFIDLDCVGSNGHEIYNYLRQFDASRHMVDSPFGYSDILRNVFYQWDNE